MKNVKTSDFVSNVFVSALRLTVTFDAGRSSGITYRFDVGDI